MVALRERDGGTGSWERGLSVMKLNYILSYSADQPQSENLNVTV